MAELTIAGIFTGVGSVVTGVVQGGLSYLDAMWANPFGQIAILTGLAGTVIGVGKSLFTRKRHI